MPQVLAQIAYFLVVSVGVPIGVINFAVQYAGLALLSALTSKLFGPKAPEGVGFSGTQVMARSGLEYRKICYGRSIMSGPVVYNNTAGGDNQFLFYQIALCDGASNDLIGIYLDNEYIPKADIDWVAGTGVGAGSGTGEVSTAQWVGESSFNAVRCFYFLGDDDQPVSAELDTRFADIDTTHRLRGVTHMVLSLLYSPETENVWQGGAPQNIRAVIEGRKVYDPRLDSTNGGTGTHRYTDASTWAWSDNPALCVADYLFNIMSVDPALAINWTSVADAADDCDVSVTIPSGTETRFTCNGVLSMGATHKDNLDSILSSMDGKLSYTGGTWTVRASVWEASSVDITANDLAGGVEIRGSAPKSERFNGVRGFFIDPARNYEAAEFPHITDSTYVTRDNGQSILYDLQLPMTNTETMAQRIAYRLLEQANNQIVVTLNLNARGIKVAVGDAVTYTDVHLGWSAKTFRCIDWSRNADSSVKVVLREDVATNYTDPLSGDYGTGNTGGVTIASNVVPSPSSLTATAVPSGIRLNWTNPAAAEFDFIDIYEDVNNSWAGATRIARVRADTYTVIHDPAETYYYWVRAIRLPALESIRNPDSDTTTITATTGSGGAGADGLSSFYAQVFQRAASPPATPTVDDGSYNFDTQTLTPPAGWSTSPPAADGNPLYVSTGIFQIAGATGTDSTVTWSAASELVSDGADGAGVPILPLACNTESIGTLPQTAAVAFNSDGTISLDGFADLTWYSGAPVVGIGASYDIRCSAVNAGSWDIQAAAVGTWISLSSSRSWSMIRLIMEGAGSDSIAGTFQISPTGVNNQILTEGVVSAEAADV